MALVIDQLKVGQGAFTVGPLSQRFSENGLWMIRGQNGAGKTTLLRTLLGRVRKVDGEFSGLRFPIGVVGVEPLLFGSWTVEENLNWFSKLIKRPIIRPPEINRFLPQKVSHLSQGMKRQVEISLVAAFKFPTLFLDEPLAPLDRSQREIFSKKIVECASQSLVLLTTHFDEELFGTPTGVIQL